MPPHRRSRLLHTPPEPLPPCGAPPARDRGGWRWIAEFRTPQSALTMMAPPAPQVRKERPEPLWAGKAFSKRRLHDVTYARRSTLPRVGPLYGEFGGRLDWRFRNRVRRGSGGTTKEEKGLRQGGNDQHVGGLSGPTQALFSILFRKKAIWE